jgi:hypothetical protein
MAMDEDSSPDEGDLKYEERGMEGMDSSDDLSAHALTDAMRFPGAAALLGFQGIVGGTTVDKDFLFLRVHLYQLA